MLSLDRRRAFGPWFFIAIAAYFALYFNDVSYFIRSLDGDALATFALSGATGMATLMTPLFAALPFSAGFCADFGCGFSGPAAMRAGNHRYLMSKLRACALSGGLTLSLGALSFILLLNLKFPTSAALMESFSNGDPFNLVLLLGKPLGLWLYYSGFALMQFFAGACWATLGLAFSAFCPNVLLTLCMPLAAYRLSLELYYWLELPYWLNLPLLQDCTVELSYPLTLLAGALVFGALTAILGAVFYFRAGRRLRYE